LKVAGEKGIVKDHGRHDPAFVVLGRMARVTCTMDEP